MTWHEKSSKLLDDPSQTQIDPFCCSDWQNKNKSTGLTAALIRPNSGKTQLQTEGGRLTWLPLPAWPIENSATLTKEKQRMWARLVQLWKVLIRLNYWRQLSVMSSEGRDESGIIRCPATQITSRDHDNSSLLRTGHNLHYSIKYRVYLRVRAPSAKVYKILFKSIK